MTVCERFIHALRAWRQHRAERRAWAAIATKHHDHWLEDAGVSPDERHRLAEKHRLDAISRWPGPHGGL